MRDILRDLAKKYLSILETFTNDDPYKNNDKLCHSHLIWMCQQIIDRDDFPIDKLNRWLGFVQGVMSTRALITVDEERDASREAFHSYYKNEGIPVPETKERQ